MQYIVVFITVVTKREARQIVDVLLRERLIACVNTISPIDSVYWWKGKIEKARAVLLIVKTEKKRLRRLIQRVKELHSYSVPEIIALPIAGGNKDYLDWVSESLK